MTIRLQCEFCDSFQHEGHASSTCYFCGKSAVKLPPKDADAVPETVRGGSATSCEVNPDSLKDNNEDPEDYRGGSSIGWDEIY